MILQSEKIESCGDSDGVDETFDWELEMGSKVILVLGLIALQIQMAWAQADVRLETQQDAQQRPVGACDFVGFMESVQKVQMLRKDRLLTAKQFAEFCKDRKTIVLDARGETDYVVLHVKGSKNLPYTSFGLASLRELIPETETRILIYCRNNFANRAVKNLLPYIEKSPSAGLNIPTAITLYSYGYDNVWELDEIVDPDDCPIEFVRQPRAH